VLRNSPPCPPVLFSSVSVLSLLLLWCPLLALLCFALLLLWALAERRPGRSTATRGKKVKAKGKGRALDGPRRDREQREEQERGRATKAPVRLTMAPGHRTGSAALSPLPATKAAPLWAKTRCRPCSRAPEQLTARSQGRPLRGRQCPALHPAEAQDQLQTDDHAGCTARRRACPARCLSRFRSLWVPGVSLARYSIQIEAVSGRS
jgi:hypothetical protein